MKKMIVVAAAALAFGGVSLAEPVNPDVNTCFGDVQTALDTNTSYDAFVPTRFLDEARVYEWKAPYSDANATPVATLVIIEGVARKRADHGDTEDVTIKCGMDAGVVRAIEIIDGHDIKIDSPVAPTRVN
ncbi:hypothetical protein sos41_24560 [Alphaproteobacteria bacterium SO-S41]|nr:hypothetical protein sos41_24560 [Alphaproteobacteria bacterium SO-S41]